MTDQHPNDQLEKNASSLDQTIFNEEGPLLVPEETDPAKLKKKKLLKLTYLGIGIIIVIAGLTLRTLSQIPQNTPTISEDTPTPTPVNVAELGPLDRLFYELDQDLELADPSENILPLPPVSARIFISSDR